MSDDRPPEMDEDNEVKGNLSRRAFLKFLMGTSIILTVIPFVPMVEYFFTKKKELGVPRKRIANESELEEGETKVFFYPGEEDIHRSFLIRLPQELLDQAEVEGRDKFINRGFVAFNTVCTHLQCPSELPKAGEIVCPCHGGFFDVLDGIVVDGPPPRPLPVVLLEMEEGTGDIYAVGLEGKIGFGRG